MIQITEKGLHVEVIPLLLVTTPSSKHGQYPKPLFWVMFSQIFQQTKGEKSIAF
jgi:hypothetical protein